jgi:hypothetical protein
MRAVTGRHHRGCSIRAVIIGVALRGRHNMGRRPKQAVTIWAALSGPLCTGPLCLLSILSSRLSPTKIGFVLQSERHYRLRLFLVLSLPQAHSRPSAVLIDEFDASGFQSSLEFVPCLI